MYYQLLENGKTKRIIRQQSDEKALINNTLTLFLSFSFFRLKLLILAYIFIRFVSFLSRFHYLCTKIKASENQQVSKYKQKKTK